MAVSISRFTTDKSNLINLLIKAEEINKIELVEVID